MNYEQKKNGIINKLNEAEAKTKQSHGKGFSLKSIKVKNSSEVAKWVEEHNYKLSSGTIYF